MKKDARIKAIQRMFHEVSEESAYEGGFNEMDQSQTELTLSTAFLQEVSDKGLKMLMDLVETCSRAGVNRRYALTREQIKNKL